MKERRSGRGGSDGVLTQTGSEFRDALSLVGGEAVGTGGSASVVGGVAVALALSILTGIGPGWRRNHQPCG